VLADQAPSRCQPNQEQAMTSTQKIHCALLESGRNGDRHARHQTSAAFGLCSAGGSAIFLYSLTAQLELAPPRGDTAGRKSPGYYSASQTLWSAVTGYIGQFAAFASLREGRPVRRRRRPNVAEQG
jgi:hypothetical protein